MNPPSKIKLHRRTQVLELEFQTADEAEPQAYELSAEFLRVQSPSAEVKGHGPGQEVLQLNKQSVAITGIEAQGNYAIKIIFSDGHDSGIYTWQYLYHLATQQVNLWQEYQAKVKHHEETKDMQAIKWISPQ
ncbi:hypothetical protein TDB9533_00347 [Thalassocella blandensis]|nr:hypothetical protein TDB9533_00347 [Thalassocella blandensis]